MPSRLSGKVALISGVARGQGRSHAVALAAEGADIIGFDICGPVQAQGAPPASGADLAETVRLVEKLDRRIVTAELDVRDHDAVEHFVAEAAAELGGLDIVVANAGINGPGVTVAETRHEDWRSVIDTNLTGTYNTVKAALPPLLAGSRGGSITLVSSSLALRPGLHFGAYTTTKHGIVGLMETLALELGGQSVRVNSVHPTGVRTDLFLNPATYRLFRPDLERPTLDDAMLAFHDLNVLPIPWIEADDVSNLVVFLATDEARYITGASIPVNAGHHIH
ncbi:mycofactocin-coupled SDR family oxidoreductase [Pseudonocardia sp. RS010]|uniref:mycofactocin-coupled SDR family oxidoreductase n=1 Tax=Pseudonocardia sp. RS010 TaxID=3385979 RepID=UPI0039A312CB